jgi:hypothetical protein
LCVGSGEGDEEQKQKCEQVPEKQRQLAREVNVLVKRVKRYEYLVWHGPASFPSPHQNPTIGQRIPDAYNHDGGVVSSFEAKSIASESISQWSTRHMVLFH